jgi:ATP-dependent DNA ligase
LEGLTPETTLDGEVVALDETGLPRFNLLQNVRSGSAHLMYFAFDVLVHRSKDVTKLSLSERREILQSIVKRGQHVDLAAWSEDLGALEAFVRERKLEGVVAKRSDSRHEPGRRSGSWLKLRFDCRQEFVVGGYTSQPPGSRRSSGWFLPG